MARLTTKERREQALALQAAKEAAIEKSSQEWLGKRIKFRDLLDKKIKEGVFARITEAGDICLEYQMFPWPDEPAEWCVPAGCEEELLQLLDGVVIG